MEIKGWKPISFLDWPGMNCSIVFLNRCNFRCRYCHNPQLAIGEESHSMPPSYILKKILEKKEWIDSIVISGGEPTLNRNLIEFCRDIKFHLGIKIKIDTNGSFPDVLETLITQNLIDKVSMDIKAPLLSEDLYRKVCQANINIENLEKSINLIADIDHEFRTTACPSLIEEKEIFEIAKELSCICRVKEYTIQNFNPKITLDPSLKDVKPYDMDVLRKIRHKILQGDDFNIIKCNIK